MLSVPLRRRAAIAMIAAAALATVTGCAATSPAIIIDPYLAADGTDAQLTLGDGTVIKLTNFLVVLGEKGEPGQVVGAVTYSGTGEQEVTLQAGDPAQVSPASPAVDPAQDPAAATPPAAPGVEFTVTGGELVQVGPEGTSFVLPAVNVAPGQYIALTAITGAAGSATWNVPVLAPNYEYAGLTVTATPTAAPSPTPTATPEATATPEGTATPEVTATPEATATP